MKNEKSKIEMAAAQQRRPTMNHLTAWFFLDFKIQFKLSKRLNAVLLLLYLSIHTVCMNDDKRNIFTVFR